MANDMIEVCSRCGKMPRGIDMNMTGMFRCTRCGNSALTAVTTDDYEKIVTGLDQQYHAELARMRLEHVRKHHPISLEMCTTCAERSAKRSPAKKSKPKKTVKKATKKRKK